LPIKSDADLDADPNDFANRFDDIVLVICKTIVVETLSNYRILQADFRVLLCGSGNGLQELIGQSGQHQHRAQHRHPRRKTL
jgi:hypothetical protein